MHEGVRYPDILATAGLSRPEGRILGAGQVGAEAQSRQPRSRVLLKTEMGAGHGGPSGRYDSWKEEAFVLSFVLDAVGGGT